MSFAEEWKRIKKKYEDAVKEKKPSEKVFGMFKKSTGIEPACVALDNAVARQSRTEGEKALTALKKAGEAYLTTLDKVLETETGLSSR